MLLYLVPDEGGGVGDVSVPLVPRSFLGIRGCYGPQWSW